MSSAPRASHIVRVRRSRHLVFYWREHSLVVHNYANGQQTRADTLLCGLLDFCADWRTESEIAAALKVEVRRPIRRLVRHLVERGLLERSDRPEDPRTLAMRALDPWNPVAGFFHTATKDVRFLSRSEARRLQQVQRRSWPMPAPVKRYRGVRTVSLPAPARGDFADVLTRRRTWRRFSATPVTVEELATLLGLSAGVQQWANSGRNLFALKTSPSGGARHPIECYVVVRAVTGLRPGIYHYASDRHALERIHRPVSVARMASYYPQSAYFAKASAHVFLTAVFERQVWRYAYARAYRAALVEAGHVCQTFCLTATWLGLAPYCLMGLADSRIEADLGIDGVSESVLYAAGVGRPPKGSAWAPTPRGMKEILRARRNMRL